MKLEQYISALLYQYDCVIVPGLGGFIANYKSATVQPIKNTFSPPSKSISFNKNLSISDGLLVNFIAQKEGLSFDDSSKKITEYVTRINRNLKLKKKILLTNIGLLFLDTENRLQFNPESATNYLLASYGLPIYQKQPIKRITIEEKTTKKFVDRAAPLVIVKKDENSKKWMYSAALIFLAFGAGLMVNSSGLSGNLSYANLNPFNTNQQQVYSPKNTQKIVSTTNSLNIKEQIALAPKNSFYVRVRLDENEPPFTVRLKEKPVAEPISTYVTETKKALKYHIVGGCFSKKKNARAMVIKLKKSGFDAFIIGKRKGLWTVSCRSFVTRKEAVNALKSVQNYNNRAWILKHSI